MQLDASGSKHHLSCVPPAPATLMANAWELINLVAFPAQMPVVMSSKLAMLCSERTAKKSYLAISTGAPSTASFHVDAPIDRHPVQK